MTKEEIVELKKEGKSYNEISNLTGLPRNTVISICRRADSQTQGLCLWCDKPLKQTGGYHRLKKFCNGTCRLKYWKAKHET